MKKSAILFPACVLFLLLNACSAEGTMDDKNKSEYYPTLDTNKPVERINDPKDSASSGGERGVQHPN